MTLTTSTKSRVDQPDVIASRVIELTSIIATLKHHLPSNAIRIEVDIEYDDGARVKVEGKA